MGKITKFARNTDIERLYIDFLAAENDYRDLIPVSEENIITDGFFFNRNSIYHPQSDFPMKDIPYLLALYKAVVLERCSNIYYAVYRYVDLEDNHVEYVGIVNTGSLYDRHYCGHMNEEWYKSGLYKCQFFQLRNRSETEAMESHLIALYGSYLYGNQNKSDWGLNSFIGCIHENMWITIDCPDIWLDDDDIIQDELNYDYEAITTSFMTWYEKYNSIHGFNFDESELRNSSKQYFVDENNTNKVNQILSKYLHSLKYRSKDQNNEYYNLLEKIMTYRQNNHCDLEDIDLDLVCR